VVEKGRHVINGPEPRLLDVLEDVGPDQRAAHADPADLKYLADLPVPVGSLAGALEDHRLRPVALQAVNATDDPDVVPVLHDEHQLAQRVGRQQYVLVPEEEIPGAMLEGHLDKLVSSV